MTTLVHHMRDNGIGYGLQTMCEGGGRANATILELLRGRRRGVTGTARHSTEITNLPTAWPASPAR
jgi:hypothetical protein